LARPLNGSSRSDSSLVDLALLSRFVLIGSVADERSKIPTPNEAALAKLLPRAVRATWERAFVTFAVDEINGLYDRIAAAQAQGDPVPPALKARILPFLQALSWDRQVAIERTWEIARRKPERPEDAFAPAMILTCLLPEDERVVAFAAALPAEVTRAVEAARP
jgi:hypothetical protein